MCPGVPGFIAPEVSEKDHRPYDPIKADVFALGLALFSLVEVELPEYQDYDEIYWRLLKYKNNWKYIT